MAGIDHARRLRLVIYGQSMKCCSSFTLYNQKLYDIVVVLIVAAFPPALCRFIASHKGRTRAENAYFLHSWEWAPRSLHCPITGRIIADSYTGSGNIFSIRTFSSFQFFATRFK